MTHHNDNSCGTPPPILRDRSWAFQEQQRRALEYDQYCQRVCARHLMYVAAGQTDDIDVSLAWEVFKLFPVEALGNLYTPSGWVSLITELRGVLRIGGPTPTVTIH